MIDQIIIELPFISILIKFMIASTCLLGGVWLMEKIHIINTPDIAEMAWKLAIAASFIAVLPISIAPSNITVPLSDSAANAARSSSPLAVPTLTTVAKSPPNSPLKKYNGSDSETVTPTFAPEALVRAGGTPNLNENADTDPAPQFNLAQPFDEPAKDFSLTTLLLISWILLAALALCALLVSYRRAIANLGNRTRVNAEHAANKTLRQICEDADIRHVPYLSRSNDIDSPVCLPHREICLPAWAFDDMDSAALRSLIAHELAHMLRRDPAQIIILQTLCRICFFQPMFAIARRRLEDCAELAADEWAAKQLSSPNAVAEALYTCAKKITQKRQIQWGLAMAGDKSILRQRVERLIHADSDKFDAASTLKRTSVSFAIAVMVLAIPGIEFATAMNTDVPGNIQPNRTIEYRPYTPAGSKETVLIPVTRVEHPSLDHGENDYENRESASRIQSNTLIVSDDNDTESGNMRWSDGDQSIRVSWDGLFILSEDEQSIASLSDGAELQIRTQNGDMERRIRLEDDDGEIKVTYWKQGEKLSFNDEAEAWFAKTLQQLIQHTAIDIENRIARYLRDGGTDAALERMADLKSDYVKRIFAMHLMRQADFSEANVKELLRNIGTLTSDYEVRLTLLEMLDTGILTPDNLDDVLEIAKGLESDYEMRLTLSPMLEHFSINDTSMEHLLELASTIQSDYELRLLLSEVTHRSFSEENASKLIDVTRSIESDYELRLLLGEIAEIDGMTEKLIEELVDTVEAIEGDYERRLALESIIDGHELSAKAWKNVIRHTEKIRGSYEKRLILEQIRDQLPKEEAIRKAWLKAAKSISSKHERNLLLKNTD